MTLLTAAAAICGLGVLGLAVWYVPAYRRFKGAKVVKCPESQATAVVAVDAVRFAATSLFARPSLALKDCSRWPARAGCGRSCLTQFDGGGEPAGS